MHSGNNNNHDLNLLVYGRKIVMYFEYVMDV